MPTLNLGKIGGKYNNIKKKAMAITVEDEVGESKDFNFV